MLVACHRLIILGKQIVLTSKTPKLDLHGEIVSMVEVLVNEFITDNLKMGYSEIIIIHGKSTNILTEEVHKVLKKNKNVRKYYKNNWNLGETIVEINEQK